MNVVRAEGLSALVIMTANFWNMTQVDTTLRTWIGLYEINLILSHLAILLHMIMWNTEWYISKLTYCVKEIYFRSGFIYSWYILIHAISIQKWKANLRLTFLHLENHNLDWLVFYACFNIVIICYRMHNLLCTKGILQIFWISFNHIN